MKIAYVHNIEIELDSRTQKEIATLRRHGHDVFFYGWNKDKTGENESKVINLRGEAFKYINICERVTKNAGLKKNYIALIKYEWKLIKALIKNHKNYDAIHVCSLDTAIIGLPLSKIYQKKCIYDIYDDYADSHIVGVKMYRILKKIDKFLIEHVDAVIICSEQRREQMASTKAKKLVIIHNTPDISAININALQIHKSNLQNSKLKVAYVGNLWNGRYTYELAQIIADNPEWELHCGGSGQLENAIKDLAKKHNNIFFYGRLAYEETLALEMQCDVIPALYDPAFPNHKYAAPNKFYEALFLGKPTIMAHNTGMDLYVEQFNLGTTIEFDEDSIRKALEKISENLIFWKQQENSIKEVYNNMFSWSVMEKRLLSLYQ